MLDTKRSITANLGTGRGHSVLEVIRAFERVTGMRIPYEVAPRRAGDVENCYADATLAGKALGWRTDLGIEDMCADAWAWQSTNPAGYAAGEDDT